MRPIENACEKVRNLEYLLGTLWNVIGVDVLLLEQAEPQLARSHVVGIWPEEHDGNGQLLHEAEGLLRRVVAGIVKEQHGVAAPVGPLGVQLLDELTEKDLDDAAVAVRLGQGEVGLPERIDAQDDGDSWSQGVGWNRVCAVFWLPFHSPEVAHGKPAFVDVEKGLARLPELDESLAPFLSHDEVACGVEVDRALDDLAVGHAHILTHDLVDEMDLDVEALVGENSLLDLLDGADDFVRLVEALDVGLHFFAQIFTLLSG